MNIAQRPWPATEIELVSMDSLLPFANNARTHSANQIEQIAGLMRQFGVTSPILRDETGVILAGHARLAAASLNLAQGDDRFARLPVMTARGWTDEEKRAYVIADNQSALLAGWDFGLLAEEVGALSGLGFDLDLLGFSEGDLRRMAGYEAGLTDPDAILSPDGLPVAQVGDLWLLGPHRVLCGSATEPGDVGQLFAGDCPTLMVTDPPYGVVYDPSWRNAAGVSASARTGKVQNDDRADWTEAWKLFPGSAAYVWCASMTNDQVVQSLETVGLQRRSQIIWRKPHFTLGRGDYHWQHECCWYAVRKGPGRIWTGDRKQSTVWDIAGVTTANGAAIEAADDASIHGTQKPVECMRRPMENNSKPGDIVYDPFLGSGTTVIAAEQSGRVCYGLEIDPTYVDVIVRRWQNFTGSRATLSGSQSTFSEIEIERKLTSDGHEGTKTEADRAQAAGG